MAVVNDVGDDDVPHDDADDDDAATPRLPPRQLRQLHDGADGRPRRGAGRDADSDDGDGLQPRRPRRRRRERDASEGELAMMDCQLQ